MVYFYKDRLCGHREIALSFFSTLIENAKTEGHHIMPENTTENKAHTEIETQAVEAKTEGTRELQRQERKVIERQASRFLKKLQLPSPALEEFQRLKNYILYENRKGKTGSLLAVTSAWPKEGVSYVSFHTAVSLAKGLENSVLLIDANFRNPSLHKVFDNPNTLGFSDLLRGNFEPHKAIRPTYMPYLSFLPSGSPMVDPAQYFRMDRFSKLLNEFKAKFDFVILDTPALSKYADCLVMGPKVDEVVLVVKAHKTKKQIVQHAKEEILKHGGKLFGVVLNKRRFFIPNWLYKRL